jgi:hypothetical protein
MNPLYSKETAAAAENAVAEQTQRTVEQIEANQIQRKTAPQRAAELEDTFRSIEAKAPVAPKLVLSGRLTVLSVDGLDGGDEKDSKVVTLTSEDGKTMIELLSTDARLLKKGAELSFEIRELSTSLDPSKSGSGPEPEKNHLIGDASLAGSQRLAAANAERDRTAANPPFTTSTKPAPDITGTTGSKGTNDVTARATEPTGEAPNPEDPNLTGPSSDAGQATKGEIVQGQQTGGKSGKGTGKGESERGAAREAGKSGAAIETKDGLDPKAPKK